MTDGWGAGVWRRFKFNLSDENRKIAGILKHRLNGYVRPPILDVGAGGGDISARAFPEKRAWLLDLSLFRSAPSSPRHKRLTGDFLDRSTKLPGKIGTIIFSHVMQYLDDDPGRLQRRITQISPEYIIEVRNDNTGLFGDLVNALDDTLDGSNPELPVDYLDNRYRVVASVPFESTFVFNDFDQMTRNIVGLIMDAPLSEKNLLIGRRVIEELLASPKIELKQTVYVFSRRLGTSHEKN